MFKFYVICLVYVTRHNSQFACHTITVVINVVFMSTALSAICVLVLLAHFMYCSHRLQQEMSERASKQVFRCCAIYIVSTVLLVLVFFLMICYDMVIDSGRYTIQPDSYCTLAIDGTYKAVVLPLIIVMINKVAHIVAFSFYLYYMYKLKQDNIKQELLRQLHKIAIAMGSAIGLSAFILYLM